MSIIRRPFGAFVLNFMKTLEKKHLTPDEMYTGSVIDWFGDIHNTLDLLWKKVETHTPRFYQQSHKFNRPVSEHAETIRDFFAKRGVHAVVGDYSDPKVGDRSWLVLIALRDRFAKY